MNEGWPWLALFLLGAYHGLNPGMGWLFAVALGLQERKTRVVLWALAPIALGHALSIGAIAGAAACAQTSIPHRTLRVASAAAIFGFGLFRLLRSRHPSWVGMRVGFRDLTLWSFMMASAHGAGLMLTPIFFSPSARPALYAAHIARGLNVEVFCGAQQSFFSSPALLGGAIGVHTLGHLLVAGMTALLVYRKLGVAVLRSAWVNLDLIWVFALVATGLCLLIF